MPCQAPLFSSYLGRECHSASIDLSGYNIDWNHFESKMDEFIKLPIGTKIITLFSQKEVTINKSIDHLELNDAGAVWISSESIKEDINVMIFNKGEWAEIIKRTKLLRNNTVRIVVSKYLKTKIKKNEYINRQLT
jgi:hypothetical protein